jgi:two-component system, LytTR family, sensor kinase
MEVQPELAELGYGHAYLARYGLRLPTALSLYAAFVVVGYATWWLTAHHRREAQRAQLEAQLATARLQALRMQLHPHFFFNTLHTIAGHVREGERDTAVELIARLSHLLRRTLRDAGRQEITLSEELDFVRDYLQLEQGRLGDGLTPRIEAGEDVKDAAVPSLLLQPLVENAIRHGIARREGAGELCIRAHRSNGRLLLEVSDDGPGYDPAPGGEGVGLANTRERLAQLYGSDHRFEIGSRPGGGTAVQLEIPLRWQPDAEA